MAYNSSILEALLNPSAYAMRNAAQGPAPWMAWAGNGQQRPAMPMQLGQPMRPMGPAPQQGQPMQPVQAQPMQPIQQPATTPVATAPFQPVAQVPMNSPTMNQMAPGMRSATVARPDVSQEMAMPGTMQQQAAMPSQSLGVTPSQAVMWQGMRPQPVNSQQIVADWNAGQANIAADSEQRRQAFEAQQAAQQAQAAASAPWEIARGVAPHQVKGRSPQEVQIMKEEARNVDDWYNRLPNQPPPVSDVGFGQRPALGMRPEDAARIAEERALQQQNSNWDNSRHIPNYDLTKIQVPLPSPGEAGERQTLDGMRAAQSRSLQQDPRYREYMAKSKEYLAKRNRGEDAVSPGPLKIARQTPDVNAVVDTMLGRMKYGDYQQQMGEKRAAAKEKNAAEKARRKTNVEAKARGTSPLKVWSEKQVMQGGGDGAELSEQQQYTMDRELYGEQTANMMAMDRSNARQAEAERTFKGKESDLDRQNRRDVVGDTYKGQADIEGVKGTQERLTAEQKGKIDKGLLEQEYNLKAKGEQLKADIANNPMSPDNQAKLAQVKLVQEKLDAIGRYRSGTASPADEALIAGPEGFPQERRKQEISLQETQNKGNKEVAEVGAGAQVETAGISAEASKENVRVHAQLQRDLQANDQQYQTLEREAKQEYDKDPNSPASRQYAVQLQDLAIKRRAIEARLEETGMVTGSSERIAAGDQATRRDLQQTSSSSWGQRLIRTASSRAICNVRIRNTLK